MLTDCLKRIAGVKEPPGYELAIYDKSGAKKQILASVPAVDGSDLRLTVDLSMEQTVETLLLQHLTSDMSGSVIVMDPKTGAIDAIASYPTFDPNIFSYTVSQAVWDYFTDEANRTPLYNRSTLGLYPPRIPLNKEEIPHISKKRTTPRIM